MLAWTMQVMYMFFGFSTQWNLNPLYFVWTLIPVSKWNRWVYPLLWKKKTSHYLKTIPANPIYNREPAQSDSHTAQTFKIQMAAKKKLIQHPLSFSLSRSLSWNRSKAMSATNKVNSTSSLFFPWISLSLSLNVCLCEFVGATCKMKRSTCDVGFN